MSCWRRAAVAATLERLTSPITLLELHQVLLLLDTVRADARLTSVGTGEEAEDVVDLFSQAEDAQDTLGQVAVPLTSLERAAEAYGAPPGAPPDAQPLPVSETVRIPGTTPAPCKPGACECAAAARMLLDVGLDACVVAVAPRRFRSTSSRHAVAGAHLPRARFAAPLALRTMLAGSEVAFPRPPPVVTRKRGKQPNAPTAAAPAESSAPAPAAPARVDREAPALAGASGSGQQGPLPEGGLEGVGRGGAGVRETVLDLLATLREMGPQCSYQLRRILVPTWTPEAALGPSGCLVTRPGTTCGGSGAANALLDCARWTVTRTARLGGGAAADVRAGDTHALRGVPLEVAYSVWAGCSPDEQRAWATLDAEWGGPRLDPPPGWEAVETPAAKEPAGERPRKKRKKSGKKKKG